MQLLVKNTLIIKKNVHNKYGFYVLYKNNIKQP